MHTNDHQDRVSLNTSFLIPGQFIQGRIQFFIDALDKNVRGGEIEVLINRFLVDLELEPETTFTERTTYTGTYNISGLGFDMSFRVQCSENYYGPNCTTFCDPIEEVYTCDSEGRLVCTGKNRDTATNCTTCLPGYDPSTNCTQCLTGRDMSTRCTTCLSDYDLSTNCTQCLIGRDVSTGCTTCLPGYDPSTNCTLCLTGRDVSTYCSQCLTNRDIRTSCTTCLPGYNPSTNCRGCLPSVQCQPVQTTSTTTITSSKYMHT